MEMIAAHSVVTPGFSIPRVACGIENGEQISLVAAGVIVREETETLDIDAKIQAAVQAGLEEAAQRRAEMARIVENLDAQVKIDEIINSLEGA